MTPPPVLSVGPYEFLLGTTSPDGPYPRADGHPAEALALAISSITSGSPPGFRAALESGGDASVGGGFLLSPRSPEEAAAMLAEWRAAGGAPAAPESLVRVGFPFVERRVVVPREVLAKAVAELEAMRREYAAPPPPWLFTRAAPLRIPHPDERAHIEALNARASKIDARAAALAGQPEPPELIAARRALLIDLGEAGLYEPALAEAHAYLLHQWGCTALAAWHSAARAMHDYHRSQSRQERIPGPPPASPLDARVCLDLFRGGVVGMPEWLKFDAVSRGEVALRAREGLQGDQGTLFLRDEQGWTTLLWRADHENIPCLLAIAPRPA